LDSITPLLLVPRPDVLWCPEYVFVPTRAMLCREEKNCALANQSTVLVSAKSNFKLNVTVTPVVNLRLTQVCTCWLETKANTVTASG
jgi:hypothetical protein